MFEELLDDAYMQSGCVVHLQYDRVGTEDYSLW